MTPLDAPPLPEFLRAALPFRRRAYRLQSGPDAGRVLHYVDHGEGVPVLLMHGNPTWCFLWRRVIAALGPGFRCVAPDALGFGLSSKLPRVSDHQLERHLQALRELVWSLDLPDGIVLVGQDWGGPFVLGAARDVTARVRGVVLGNTSVLVPRRPRGTLFHRFANLPLVSDLVFRGLGFPQRGGMAIAQGDRTSIAGEVARAYRWPLSGPLAKAGPLGLARMVPSGPDHESLPALHAIDDWIRAFRGPLHLVWGERDPILGKALDRHERELNPAKVVRTPAGHFLQEQVPELIAAEVRAVAAAAAPVS